MDFLTGEHNKLMRHKTSEEIKQENKRLRLMGKSETTKQIRGRSIFERKRPSLIEMDRVWDRNALLLC